MQTVFICGGNRGIGLELCKQFTARGDKVIASCRTSSEELEQTGVEIISGIDVTDPAGVKSLKHKLNGVPIDILIHNAGILSRETLQNMDFDAIENQFRVNTIGPLRVICSLFDNLDGGSKICVISSRMGSISDNQSGGRYGYRISKAGLNAAAVSLARDLAEKNISVLVLHPGLVATAMTGWSGIPPAESAIGMIQRIDELTPETSGSFWHAQGYELPW